MSAPTLAQKVAFLSDLRSYPQPTHGVQRIETHFSWIFLTDRHAYKLKKPQRQAGMDYRSVAARRRGCLEELRLNKRLARSVYLEVIPLSVNNEGELQWGRGRRVVDWVLKMTRLPGELMLDRALVRRRVTHRQLETLVAALAAFYASATPSAFSGAHYLERIRRQVIHNQHALMVACPGIGRDSVEAVVCRQLAFVGLQRRALGVRARRVVEAHGDLRPEHICLAHPVCVIDCLEFNRDLRLLDPAEEIAFLALEVARLGHTRVACDLVALYRKLSGDRVSDSVMHFYMSRRALTRAMLAAQHLTDPKVSDRDRWLKRTYSYLQEARRQCDRARRLADRAHSSGSNGQRVRRGASARPSSIRRSA